MTFEQLTCFIKAVDSPTFFDAAEQLNLSQSALSKQIQKLEKELNILLFDRSRRSAEVTAAGKQFYLEAQNLMYAYETMQEHMQKFWLASELCLGTLPILSQYHLTEKLHHFAKTHPEFCLNLQETEEPELLSGLNSGQFHIILARESLISHTSFDFVPVAGDQLCVMLPAAHPLAGHPSLSLSDIADEKLILMHPYTSIYQLCTSLFADAGIAPKILRTARMESIISSVRLGDAISLFPGSNFSLFRHDGVTAVPLSDAPNLRIGFAFSHEQAKNPGIRLLLKWMK